MPRVVRWIVTLGCSALLLQLNSRASADAVPEITEKSFSPAIEVLERPSGIYRTDDLIIYRIRIQWPSLREDIRLQPPGLALENLKLLDTKQETLSRADGEKTQWTQVLTFRFRPQAPGPARIRQFILKWSADDQTASAQYALPALSFTIERSLEPIVRLAFGSLFLLIFAFTGVFFFRLRKGRDTLPAPPPLSLEERSLNELEELRSGQPRFPEQEFLSELSRVFESYLIQKLDWNPQRDGYNALSARALEKWSKKEVEGLETLRQKIEHCRFSGEPRRRDEAIELCQSVYSFIQGKRIVSTS